MAKSKRKTHLNATMKQEIKDVQLDTPSIIILSFVGLIASVYSYFAVVALYKIAVSNG